MNCDTISYLCFAATRLVALENFRFSVEAQYAIRVSPDVHSNARRFFFVALRSQGQSPKESVLLPFSFPDRHSAKRDGGLLLPYPRGDRPPGNVPDGMSKIKFRSFPQNTANYTKTAARESSAAVWPRFREKQLKAIQAKCFSRNQTSLVACLQVEAMPRISALSMHAKWGHRQ